MLLCTRRPGSSAVVTLAVVVASAAAAATGMRTAFIHRPNEFGPGNGGPFPHEPVDLIVHSAEELADKLGA